MIKKPQTFAKLVELARTPLSKSFFLRDFLYSEIAAMHGMSNMPDDPELAIASGTRLCQELLEPLQDAFGPLHIVSGYRSAEVNAFGYAKNYGCASNERSAAGHIWDLRDYGGQMGATAGVVIPSLAARMEAGDDWKRLAWWIHDNLPYGSVEFLAQRPAFNLQWHEKPLKMVYSHIREERGYVTKPGMPGHDGDHRAEWEPLTTAQPQT